MGRLFLHGAWFCTVMLAALMWANWDDIQPGADDDGARAAKVVCAVFLTVAVFCWVGVFVWD